MRNLYFNKCFLFLCCCSILVIMTSTVLSTAPPSIHKKWKLVSVKPLAKASFGMDKFDMLDLTSTDTLVFIHKTENDKYSYTLTNNSISYHNQGGTNPYLFKIAKLTDQTLVLVLNVKIEKDKKTKGYDFAEITLTSFNK